jgi:hypothetical protein
VAELNDSLPKSTIVIGIQPEDIKTMSMELSVRIKEKIDDLVQLTLEELFLQSVIPEPANNNGDS